MNKETLEYICHLQMLLTGVPTRLYSNKEMIKRYEPHKADFDLLQHYENDLLNFSSSVNLILTKQFLMFGAIKQKGGSNLIMVIGPGCSAPITNKTAKQIALSNDLNLNLADDIKEYLQQIEIISVENFAATISLLNSNINNEIIKSREILKISSFLEEESEVYNRLISSSNQLPENNSARKRFSYEYEELLKFFVKNGMLEKLSEHMINNYKDRQGIVAFDAMRQYKNRCISMITIISRAAIEGGANPATCYQLADLYCQKIELSNTMSNINTLMNAMIVDFTERAGESQHIKSDNPVISRVIKYINENINQKLRVKDLVEIVHTNPSYLSVKFKKSTGISLPHYINMQKINEAKRLLKFSDKSLVEISNYLSFSTQSYFQNQFKKITGLTPTEYRKSCK